MAINNMLSASTKYEFPVSSIAANELKVRHAIYGKEPEVFTDIYSEETNIVVWQRELSQTLQYSVNDFLRSNPTFQLSMTVTPNGVLSSIRESLGGSHCTTRHTDNQTDYHTENQAELSESIAELVDMFCCLFDLKRAGLRLTALDRAMCPKFHVDRVPCRLVTTFQGVATEWLPHQSVDRDKLGRGSNGLPDHQSGLFKIQQDIQQLNCGDVGLLKGEIWPGNENAGLVHRSPAVPTDNNRLLLTLDFSN